MEDQVDNLVEVIETEGLDAALALLTASTDFNIDTWAAFIGEAALMNTLERYVSVLPTQLREPILNEAILYIVGTETPDNIVKKALELLIAAGGDPFATTALETATENRLDTTIFTMLRYGSDDDHDRLDHIEHAVLYIAKSSDSDDSEIRLHLQSYLPEDSPLHYDIEAIRVKVRAGEIVE
jgi:hypothetical protein